MNSASPLRFAAVALALSAGPLAAAGWERLPPLPEPNGGFVCGEEEGRIIVIGGTNWENDTKRFLTHVNIFDPQAMTWGKWGTIEEPIAYAVSGNIGGHLVWAGGTNGEESVRSFANGKNSLPTHVVLSAGGVIGDEFVFVGGTDDPANLAGLTRAAFAANGKSGAVEKLPDFPGQPTGVAASAVLGGQLFVFGGAHWKDAVVNTADAFAFTLATREWRKLKPLPFPARGFSAVALDERRIYVAGGYKNDVEEFSDTAFLYDVQADTYTPAPPLPYRGLVGLVKCGDFLYCLGGEDRKKSRTDQCWRVPVAELLPR